MLHFERPYRGRRDATEPVFGAVVDAFKHRQTLIVEMNECRGSALTKRAAAAWHVIPGTRRCVEVSPPRREQTDG